MIRIVLAGAAGRMGKAVRALAEETPGVEIVALVDPNLNTRFETCDVAADVVVDFSVPAALSETLAFCAKRGLPLVLATTGHGEEADAQIADASENIAILRSANLSFGACVLARLAAKAREWLGDAYEVTIVETHHKHKKDAPSGTAKLLLSAMETPDAPALSIRGGAVVGIHEVQFLGEKDVLTLRHEALDRTLFARGALDAAKWIAQCAPGLYGMEDFIGSGET